MLELIETKDKSHTLYNSALDETYHSRHGAITESKYVFIEKGLQYRLEMKEGNPCNILEVGFGTGLNAFLTLLNIRDKDQLVHYHTLEPYPLGKEIYQQLNYPEFLGEKNLFIALHEGEFECENLIDEKFFLSKTGETIHSVDLFSDYYHLIYYDAFAPSKQADVWDLSHFEKIFRAMAPRGVLVTYCAKGQLKRDLKQVGFEVETLPGPPGKKEMVRAVKSNT
ncbi:MAG: tRNA (5-methylaminomethyl-2-thiouridine)(34)-methyltransferase MnmD [Cyclobacteriaceae bacterium]|nr:tRNA (5-methylaminomethyl-2-thiouridine)(34)-methyltransferase MnmD [Cyclobacteriaceae bacterium]